MDAVTQFSMCLCYIGGCFAVVYFFFTFASFLRLSYTFNADYSAMFKLALLSMACITIHFFVSGFDYMRRNLELRHGNSRALQTTSFLSNFTLNTAIILAYCTFFLRIKMWSQQTASPIEMSTITKFYVQLFLAWIISICQWIVANFMNSASGDRALAVLCWFEAILMAIPSGMLIYALYSRLHRNPLQVRDDTFRKSLLEDITIDPVTAFTAMDSRMESISMSADHEIAGGIGKATMDQMFEIQESEELAAMESTESTDYMKMEMVKIWVLLIWCITSTFIYALIFLIFISMNGSIRGNDAFYAIKVMVRVITGWIYCVCMRMLFPFTKQSYGMCCWGLHARCHRCLLRRRKGGNGGSGIKRIIVDNGGYNSLQPESLQTK